MEIKDERNYKTVEFDEIHPLSCFEYDGEIYLKLYTDFPDGCGNYFNAVCLEYNAVKDFENDTMVIALKTKLTVTN